MVDETVRMYGNGYDDALEDCLDVVDLPACDSGRTFDDGDGREDEAFSEIGGDGVGIVD